MGVLGLDGILYKLVTDMQTKTPPPAEESDETVEGFAQPTETEAWAIILTIFIARIILIYLLVPFAWNSSVAPAIGGKTINGSQALGFAIFLELLI